MNCIPRRSYTFLKGVSTKVGRLRPVLALAAMLVVLAFFVSGVMAQKGVDSPDGDPVRDQAYRSRERALVETGQDVSRLFQRHTIELAPGCSPELLRATLSEMLAAGRLKQPPLQMGNQIGIVVEKGGAQDLAAVPCVQDIRPGWQLSSSPRPAMEPDAIESGASGTPDADPEQPALAAGTGHINGTVTADASGAALSGISVCADFDNGSYWQSAGCATSDVNGDYDIGGLEAGEHRVLFTDANGDYAWEFYDNAHSEEDAAAISVAAGGTTAGINASLAERGHITGTVTAENGGAPLFGIYVCAYLYDQNSGWQAWIGCEYSDVQGQYDIGYLPGGVYRVEFHDPGGVYLREYYNGAADLDSATDISVTEGFTTSGINATLADAGHITGTVTAEVGGTPLEYIDVCAYFYDGAFWQGAGCSSTAANGFYDIGGLPGGSYRVSFADLDNGYYLSEFYNDAADIESAADVAVTAGSTTPAIDAVLAEPGHIRGTVTIDPGGVALEAVEACAYAFDGSDWLDAGCEITAVNGDYDIGELPPGIYRVGFRDLFEFYAWEFYDDVLDIGSAGDVLVSSGGTTTGINAALIEGGQITGTVTTEGGTPLLQEIAACAYFLGAYGWQFVGCGYSEADGGYTIGGLAGGVYRVEFYDWFDGVYQGEFYDNAQDLSGATDIAVTAGSTTAGIHAALIEFGHITGTVTAEFGGEPLFDIEVCAYFHNGAYWQWLHCDYSASNGDYDIGGLTTGAYRVEFVDYRGTYLSEFYDNAADVDSADDIAVASGSSTTGINAELRDYGHIAGTVTAEAGGASLTGVRVCSYFYKSSYWRVGRCADTDANGNYDIGGLTAANYRVGFFDGSGSYQIEYYNDSPNINSAADVQVSDDATTAGIDVALASLVPTPPANDDFDAAPLVQTVPYQNILDARHATSAADDPVLTCGPNDKGHGSVWYAITPSQASLITVNTFGSNYDTVISIWEGTRGSLVDIACNDDVLGVQSQITAASLAGGVTYYIEVVGYDGELGELVLNIDLVPNTPFADCVSDTGSSASIDIPAGVIVIGSLILAPGDEFALLTPDGSVCAGHGVWTGSNLTITAWGDDTQTAEIDGFVEGDEIKFLIWDYSKDKMYLVTNVTFAFTSHGFDTYKAGESYVVAILDVAPRVIQRISLSAGWNLISSYVEPEYPDLETLLADIESKMILIKNGAGEVYWPEQSFNGIGDWDVRDGYKVYMNSPVTLIISGAAVEPEQMPLILPAGWSTISYLRSSPAPVDQALNSISGLLVIAKNGHGEVYWPAFGVNQIGDMQPDEGYQVYLSAGGTLTYPANE